MAIFKPPNALVQVGLLRVAKKRISKTLVYFPPSLVTQVKSSWNKLSREEHMQKTKQKS